MKLPRVRSRPASRAASVSSADSGMTDGRASGSRMGSAQPGVGGGYDRRRRRDVDGQDRRRLGIERKEWIRGRDRFDGRAVVEDAEIGGVRLPVGVDQ